MIKAKTDWIYKNNASNTLRFALGEKGTNILGCIGVNPSTACPKALDNTIKSVKRISEYNSFDGWVMYNLFPQRATNPKDLIDNINTDWHEKNLDIVVKSVKSLGINTIWLAYGDLIESRQYLLYCLDDLYLNLKECILEWKTLANVTKKGHPRHPLYKPSKSKLYSFDLENYIANIKPVEL